MGFNVLTLNVSHIWMNLNIPVIYDRPSVSERRYSSSLLTRDMGFSIGIGAYAFSLLVEYSNSQTNIFIKLAY